MTKESLFIHVSGSPFGSPAGNETPYLFGQHTHMRSEGSWMMSIALNMARHGHPTTILGYNWGDTEKYPLPKNISLQSGFYGECDIFIDVGWEDVYAPQRFAAIKAKHYLHGWGGDPAGSSFLKYATEHGLKNHYMARTSRCFRKNFEEYPHSLYAPTALVDKIPIEPNLNSKKMLWGNRGAFNRDYAKYSEEVLQFMERHADYEYTVLLYGDIVEKATELNRLDIVKRFEKLPNAHLMEPYYGMPHDKFLDELSQSKILLANGNPSAHPQTLEAVCMGCIPLTWSIAENHFQTTDFKSVPLENGFDGTKNIDALMDDKDLHRKYFKQLREVTLDHEYDISYNILMNEIYNKEF